MPGTSGQSLEGDFVGEKTFYKKFFLPRPLFQKFLVPPALRAEDFCDFLFIFSNFARMENQKKIQAIALPGAWKRGHGGVGRHSKRKILRGSLDCQAKDGFEIEILWTNVIDRHNSVFQTPFSFEQLVKIDIKGTLTNFQSPSPFRQACNILRLSLAGLFRQKNLRSGKRRLFFPGHFLPQAAKKGRKIAKNTALEAGKICLQNFLFT